MESKNPVPSFYYSQDEWDRLGCGPLPPERDISRKIVNNQETENETDIVN